MPTYPWRRFKSSHSSCVAGSQTGLNYTSHHLRCGQIESLSRRNTCSIKKSMQSNSSRSWPGSPPSRREDEEEDSFSNVWTPQPELQYTYNDEPIRSSESHQISAQLTSAKPSTTFSKILTQPPRCRLPDSMRITTLVLYVTLILSCLLSFSNAAPLKSSYSVTHVQFHNRQAIPDRFNRTGNEPAAIKAQPPTQPASTPPSFTFNPTPPQTTNANPGTSGNTSPNPGPSAPEQSPSVPPTPLSLSRPQFSFSAGIIAAIAGGGTVLLCILIGVSICVCRRRRIEVQEIPIRRSKIGSRLGFRVFPDSSSRNGSRRPSDAMGAGGEKQIEAGWTDKGTISRPTDVRLENRLLTVPKLESFTPPKPAFARDSAGQNEDDKAPWLAKEMISQPRPTRPTSAEPLGRLSGMGMGMGYLK